MKISILCSGTEHPVYRHLVRWTQRARSKHDVALVTSISDVQDGGDLLILISCSEVISRETRARFRHSLVVHASGVPKGRGWSPHIWQILEGADTVPVTLLEVDDRVDSGAIWTQRVVRFEGHELYDEINAKLFETTLELMDFAIQSVGKVRPRLQEDVAATYYRKRTPQDSRLDPDKTFAEQFDLLRVADPQRFPCFFEHRGNRYLVLLKKDDRQ